MFLADVELDVDTRRAEPLDQPRNVGESRLWTERVAFDVRAKHPEQVTEFVERLPARLLHRRELLLATARVLSPQSPATPDVPDQRSEDDAEGHLGQGVRSSSVLVTISTTTTASPPALVRSSPTWRPTL